MPSTALFITALSRFYEGEFSFRLDTNQFHGEEQDFAKLFNLIASSTQQFTEEVEQRVETMSSLNDNITTTTTTISSHNTAAPPGASALLSNSSSSTTGPFQRVSDSIDRILTDAILPVSDIVQIVESIASGNLLEHHQKMVIIPQQRASRPYQRVIRAVHGTRALALALCETSIDYYSRCSA